MVQMYSFPIKNCKVVSGYLYSTTERTSTYASDRFLTTSELPLDFSDAVERAASASLKCINQGFKRARIDFDTTIGDQTFTSIKNTLPVVKELLKIFSTSMDLYDEKNITSGSRIGTIRVFFPDMGAAVLARRDWQLGSQYSIEKALAKKESKDTNAVISSGSTPASSLEAVLEKIASSESPTEPSQLDRGVPACVLTANIQNDPLEVTDKLALILCPQYSEADYVKRVMDMCDFSGVPVIIINPQLINMDQGFGVRARNIRKNLINTFTSAYKLKTLKTGAVVQEWPAPFSVWSEDSAQEGGYKLLKSSASDPTREELDELFDEQEALLKGMDSSKKTSNAVLESVNGIIGFFKGMSRL
eukprot:CAMPEP_0201107014 /NCGR_PEP_ID=MMETSP0812-20130820/54500_1 /ASSEMBLY_ACC=CAM_ASM_000668 /TAXON_ID=98059 /ORGANISM="Dinobryon sp., Strain UTEXLB2267" /LENGTH=359 /DNA_ID=CAMNT_0047367657 /DNA_START=101 /DNA_END=1180 /DNA_ORIENTATION=+